MRNLRRRARMVQTHKSAIHCVLMCLSCYNPIRLFYYMAIVIPDILTFLHRANKLKSIRRYKSSLSQNGDTVAEHSWRLALMVFVIGKELDEPIDILRAMQMALLHDLAELKTDDIDATEIINGEIDLEDKQKNEERAMQQILQGISFKNDILSLWNEYAEQESNESKFVKALDKIESFLHLDETGTSTYFPEQFHGDYADAAVKSFDEAVHHFPPLQKILDPIKEDLKMKFVKVGVEWV